jgi:hypothetical protein
MVLVHAPPSRVRQNSSGGVKIWVPFPPSPRLRRKGAQNVARPHPSLLPHKAYLRVTPAMEAGIANHVWSLEEIVELI